MSSSAAAHRDPSKPRAAGTPGAGQRDGWLGLVVLLPFVLALITGMASGLVRLGLDLPASGRLAAINHGGLMVGGVIGTVIGLERAVASGRRAAYVAPFGAAAGALALVLAPRSDLGPLLLTAGAAALMVLFLVFLRRQRALPLAVMSAGVACWVFGNAAWLIGGWSPREVVPWWIAFLALTIAGERLELTRFLPLTRTARGLLGIATLLAGAGPLLVSAGEIDGGVRLLGVATLGLGVWLLQHDTARRTYRRGGIASYAGVALLAAYGWLAVAGVGLLVTGMEFGAHYDPILHAFFLGFVIGAIFAHAPIIFPAVSGLELRFNPLFVVGLAILHVSITARIVTGVLELAEARRVAGLLNVVAILLLGAAVAAGLLAARRRHRREVPLPGSRR